MADLNANEVLATLRVVLPDAVVHDLIIVGSLAAAAQLLDEQDVELRTKDIDGMLAPNARVIAAGQELATSLLKQGWVPNVDQKKYAHPANANTPNDKLPVVRLMPPGINKEKWFLELLGAPPSLAPNHKGEVRYSDRVVTPESHFEIPSFAYLGVAQHLPVLHATGLWLARVEMMALSNLLHHPVIGPQRMGEPIAGQLIKRSNKDLGRVVAMAYLRAQQDDEAVATWPDAWRAALQELAAPEETIDKLQDINSGIYQMRDSELDTDEALHAINHGLLSSRPLTRRQLQIAIDRYLLDTD